MVTTTSAMDAGLMEKPNAVAFHNDDDDDAGNDENISNEKNKNDAAAPVTLQAPFKPLKPHRKKLYILSLIQMYQDIYQQYITQFYKDMIWNMTKARRAMQSRSLLSGSTSASGSSSSNGTSATLLSVTHIPVHRMFHAQRRLFYNNDASSASSPPSSFTIGRPNHCKLYECDAHGRTTHVTLPLLVKEDEEDIHPIENENHPHDHNHNDNNTGLRQRRGRPVTSSTKLMINNDNENAKVVVESEKLVPESKTEHQHMIQLLLLSSGTGMGTTNTHPQKNSNNSTNFQSSSSPHLHLLQLSQNKSIQMLQYIATVQSQLLLQLQQEITTQATTNSNE